MIFESEIIKKWGLSQNQLKLIALALMIVDHIGAVLLPQHRILRYIGRLSFPIYCFLITEGYIHTKNIWKYALRLLIFAVISEIPFDLAISGVILEFGDQNVFFTLLLGLITLYLWDIMPDMSKGLSAVFMICIIALLANVDYSFYGIMMILLFYIFRYRPFAMLITIGLTNIMLGLGGTGSQKYAILSLVFIFAYSGKKTRKTPDKKPGEKEIESKNNIVSKYLFYISYPLHLLILYFIS